MSGSSRPSSDSGEEHLETLQRELAALGARSDLDTCTAWPRLRVYGRPEINPRLAEFDNSVVAARFGHEWWFAWPWAEKISRVTDPVTAADRIVQAIGLRSNIDVGDSVASPSGDPADVKMPLARIPVDDETSGDALARFKEGATWAG